MRIDAVARLLDSLNQEYVSNFDPVRFAFIQSLFRRLSHHKSNSILIEKVAQKAQHYLNDLDQAKVTAQEKLNEMGECSDSHRATAQSFIDRCQFMQFEDFSRKLARKAVNDQHLSNLRGLTLEINQSSDRTEENDVQMSIDDVLSQQEQSARQVEDSHESLVDGAGEQLELQSMKRFRQSMKHFDIDKIIARALNEGPENPGPLNPQMLAIKALEQMRDLSPDYLRRFAGYIETLLWLEKNQAKLRANK